MNVDFILALVFILIAMVIGEIVSNMTKAFVPSVFVTAVLFLVGYWTIFPQDVVTVSSLGGIANLSMYLLIAHMGSMMNTKELMAQWKTVLISLAGVFGIVIILMTIGSVILGRETVITGAPPLTGGIVAAILMQEAAAAKGMELLSILAILVYVAQGFVGYPITAVLLKKEGKRLLANYDKNHVVVPAGEEKVVEKKKLIPPVPKKYNTTYMLLLKLIVVGLVANRFAGFVNGLIVGTGLNFSIHPLVVTLVLGVIAGEIGLLDKEALTKANSFGLTMTALMAFIFDGLKNATPEMLLQVAGPLFGVIVIGVVGLILLCIIVGKILGESIPMAISIGMNALYGFPPNYILTEEAIKALTEDEGEKAYLTSILMPKMLVGGFTSVTIASVIIGGIFAGML